MSIEAFIWNYRDGAPIGFDFGIVRDILSTDDTCWLDECGCLRVQFREPGDGVEIFLGRDARATNHIDGIVISRPIAHPEFLQKVFRVMQLGDVLFFYSDETTPVFAHGADSGQYPADLLKELGQPRYVTSPGELLHQNMKGRPGRAND